MKLTFEITRVTILQKRYGPDNVSLHTTNPSPAPGFTEESLYLDFKVARGGGPEYVRQLGIPDSLVEVVPI